MLVLTRKVGERIVMSECDLTVTVLAVRGKSVRLGISAPPTIAVHREEVCRRSVRPAPNSAGLPGEPAA